MSHASTTIPGRSIIQITRLIEETLYDAVRTFIARLPSLISFRYSEENFYPILNQYLFNRLSIRRVQYRSQRLGAISYTDISLVENTKNPALEYVSSDTRMIYKNGYYYTYPGLLIDEVAALGLDDRTKVPIVYRDNIDDRVYIVEFCFRIGMMVTTCIKTKYKRFVIISSVDSIPEDRVDGIEDYFFKFISPDMLRMVRGSVERRDKLNNIPIVFEFENESGIGASQVNIAYEMLRHNYNLTSEIHAVSYSLVTALSFIKLACERKLAIVIGMRRCSSVDLAYSIASYISEKPMVIAEVDASCFVSENID